MATMPSGQGEATDTIILSFSFARQTPSDEHIDSQGLAVDVDAKYLRSSEL
jgi:hypothetical protein